MALKLRTDEGARTNVFWNESFYDHSRDRALAFAIWVGVGVVAFAVLMFIILTPW